MVQRYICPAARAAMRFQTSRLYPTTPAHSKCLRRVFDMGDHDVHINIIMRRGLMPPALWLMLISGSTANGSAQHIERRVGRDRAFVQIIDVRQIVYTLAVIVKYF